MLMLPTGGCDTHLDTITTAIMDCYGADTATVTVPNTPDGWNQILELCATSQVATVGIEGASGYGRCLAETLDRAGIRVIEIPTRLTARTRRVDGAGKTDPGDARTIARATQTGHGHHWRNQPDLETIRVLTARRDHLVRTQTADINQLRALIADIDPDTAAHLPRLRSATSLQHLTHYTPPTTTSYTTTVTQLITDIATDCLTRLDRIRTLERRINTAMPPVGHALTTIQGAGVIVAAQILSQLAGTDGFTTDANMASWAGTAPLDATSGRQQRHRLNRQGNRQTNRALHTIILTQHRTGGPAAAYITRRLNEGKTTREAIRAAKRHLTRQIWKTLRDHNLT